MSPKAAAVVEIGLQEEDTAVLPALPLKESEESLNVEARDDDNVYAWTSTPTEDTVCI